jgi:two-component system nitrogen regulation response regulator NtrX
MLSSSKEIDTDSYEYPLKQAREKFEKNYLSIQLNRNNGNIAKTADFIGMERTALHRKLKSLGLI